jgi:PAS domain S-box-containing protein
LAFVMAGWPGPAAVSRPGERHFLAWNDAFARRWGRSGHDAAMSYPATRLVDGEQVLWLFEATAAPSPEDGERYRALIERSPDPLLLLDAEGRITFASPAADRFFERAPSDLLGSPLAGQISAEECDAFTRLFGEVVAAPDAAKTGPTRLSLPSGRSRPCDLSLTNLLADPRVGAVAVTLRDATSRARAEARCAGLETRWGRFFDNQLCGVAIADPSGRLIDGNAALAAIFRCRRDELPGGVRRLHRGRRPRPEAGGLARAR